MKNYVLSFITLCISSYSFAMLCPSNFNEYNIGDSFAAVQQACGKPDKETTTDSKANQPQEWIYFANLGSSGNMQYSNNNGGTAAATVRMTIGFGKDGKVSNMTVNGIGVGATPVCGNNVQIGDSMESVKASCGAPAMINQSTNNANAETTKITEWTYTNTGSAPATLIFNNEKLTGRK